jgi:DNA repair protein RadC
MRMKKIREDDLELKESYFDGYEYNGFRVRTKLVIEGDSEYKPLRFTTPAEVYHAFKNLGESDKERFYSIHLDNKNKVLGVEMVSQGCLDSSPVHPREVYKSALLSSAASIIFVHSHPSGEPDPSISDRAITEQLVRAGRLMGINVLDHVIIGRDGYYSFSDSEPEIVSMEGEDE